MPAMRVVIVGNAPITGISEAFGINDDGMVVGPGWGTRERQERDAGQEREQRTDGAGKAAGTVLRRSVHRVPPGWGGAADSLALTRGDTGLFPAEIPPAVRE